MQLCDNSEVLLEAKLNEELLRLCRRHGWNEKRDGQVLLVVLFILGLPIVGVIYYLIQHGEVSGFPWVPAGSIFALALCAGASMHLVFSQRRKALNAEIRRACREAIGFGFYIVRRTSRYHHSWYPYAFVLAASRIYTDDRSDDISDRKANLKEYPDPYGISGLLEGATGAPTENGRPTESDA